MVLSKTMGNTVRDNRPVCITRYPRGGSSVKDYFVFDLRASLIMAFILIFFISQPVFGHESVLDNTLRGAAKGAIIGGIAGDAGKGAAAGAAGGALFGNMTTRPGPRTTAGGDLLTGAAKGAVIGGIAGDAGKGAAAGAVGSALFGGIRRHNR